MYQALALLVYAVALMIASRNIRGIIDSVRANPATFLLVGLALSSALWSVQPWITMRRAIALLGTTLFGLCLGLRLSTRQLLVLVIGVATVCALGTMIVTPLNLEGAVHVGSPHDGSWRGLFTHRSGLGVTMMLGLAGIVMLSVHDGRVHLPALLSAVALAGPLWLSQSATAILISSALLACLPVLLVMSRGRFSIGLMVLIGSVILGTGIALVVTQIDSVLAVVGRDQTLTGRVFLWSELLGRLHAERPLLGYGFAAYFYDLGTRASVQSWAPSYAHNGLLEVMVDLGYLGALLAVASLSTLVWQAQRMIRSDRRSIWQLVFIAMIVLLNVPDSQFLAHNNLFWALVVTVGVTTAKRRRSSRGSMPRASTHRPSRAGIATAPSRI